jgi:hypothetical protein
MSNNREEGHVYSDQIVSIGTGFQQTEFIPDRNTSIAEADKSLQEYYLENEQEREDGRNQ